MGPASCVGPEFPFEAVAQALRNHWRQATELPRNSCCILRQLYPSWRLHLHLSSVC